MQFFTYDRMMGLADEDDIDPVKSYFDYINRLNIDTKILKFALTIDLNDAYIDRVIFNPINSELKLLLLTGSNQIGYWHTELIYTKAIIVNVNELKMALKRRPSEIWYDEFSMDDGKLCHSFLIATDNFTEQRDWQFQIKFDTFNYEQSPAQDRDLSTVTDESTWE